MSFEIEDFAHSSMTKPNNSAIRVAPLNDVGNWISVMGIGIELLEEIINTSEGDNGGPKTQLAANIRSSSLCEILYQLWKMIPFHLLSFRKQTLQENDAKSVSQLCAERG